MNVALRLTKYLRASCWSPGLLAFAAAVAAAQPDVPVTAGVTFTIAVSNVPAQPDSRAPVNVAQGDYEVVVAITAVNQSVKGLATAVLTSSTSNPNPSVYGEALTFTASVSGTAGTPTGSVTFLDNGNAFADVDLLGGTAQISENCDRPWLA